MRINLFLLILLVVGRLCAQTGQPQQQLLRQSLANLDTARTPASRAFAQYTVSDAFYQNNQPDSVLKYNLLAEKTCRENGLNLLLGRTLMARSRVLINTGEYQAMIPLLTEAAQIFEQLDDKYRQAYAAGNLANVYASLGQTDNAFKMYRQVSKMMTTLNDTVGIADCFLNIALIYEDERGKEDSAFHYLDEAIRLYSSVPDQEQGLAIAYTSKGSLMRRLERRKEAIGFYLLAIRAARVVNDMYVVVDIHNALADTYLENKEYDNALKRIEEGLKICDEIDYIRGAMDLRTSRAMLHVALKEYQQAIALYEATLSEAQNAHIKSVELTACAGLAEAYHKAHQRRQARHYDHMAAGLKEEMRLHPETNPTTP